MQKVISKFQLILKALPTLLVFYALYQLFHLKLHVSILYTYLAPNQTFLIVIKAEPYIHLNVSVSYI